MNEPTQVQLTLQADGVIAPAQHAALIASEAVGTCIRALEKDDCTPNEGWGNAIKLQIKGLDVSADARRQIFIRWALSKGFQDLARGLRSSLQEALFFISMLETGSRQITWDDLQCEMDQLRALAATLKFPELLRRVNLKLREPLSWEREFQSFQNVRNCLEHRNGLVTERDLDPTSGSLLLTFPRFKMFYVRGDEEIELVPPCDIDTSEEVARGSDGGIPIRGRLESTIREYHLGDSVEITSDDFFAIAMGCSFMATDLGAKLPGTNPAVESA